MVVLACLALLVLGGLVEALAAARARAAVPIRVHVNGTRGKSTVTRLIAAALREAGVPAVAKVTGTAPRLLLPDGGECPIVRRGPANIREQLRLLWTARRLGARAVVVECMAVRPDLQWTSERRMLASTIGVVTNVRPDHGEVMGSSRDEVARSLANTVPRHGTLVLGDPRVADIFRERAARLGSRVVLAPGPIVETAAAGRQVPRAWRAENEAVALAVTRELGIADEVARAGMARYAPDPGEVSAGQIVRAGGVLHYLDATAANDPESFDLLMEEWQQRLQPDSGIRAMVAYNHRSDRPERLRAFVRESRHIRGAKEVVITGDRPALALSRSIRRVRAFVYVHPATLGSHLADLVGGGAQLLVFAGNTRGFSLENAFRQVQQPPARAQRGIHG